MSEAIKWPRKTREMHNHHFDSTIWNDFKFRDDDIIIATYAKSGTTWMQQIIAQMLFGPDADLEVAEMSPWLDLRVPPKEIKLPAVEAQNHRRFLKTHLPVDALVFSPKAKYIYIGRDGRDVVWSMYNHHANANATWYAALNDTPWKHSFVPKFSPLMVTLSPGLTSSGSTFMMRGRFDRSHTGSFWTLFSSNPLIDSTSKRVKPAPSVICPSFSCSAPNRSEGAMRSPPSTDPANVKNMRRIRVPPCVMISVEHRGEYRVRR